MKYRYDGTLYPKDLDVFRTYPYTNMLVVNTFFPKKINKIPCIDKELDADLIKDLIVSRFHIYRCELAGKNEKTGDTLNVIPIRAWLKEVYGIYKPDLIAHYEDLVFIWTRASNERF